MIRVQDRTVSGWLVRMPQFGEWRAHIRLESSGITFAEGDPITLSDDVGNEWIGTVRATTALGAFESVEVIAGADGLDTVTTERFYRGRTRARDVLADLCGDGGETADDTDVQTFAQWRTRGRRLRDEIETLARWTMGVWRHKPDGEITLTPDTPTPGETLGDMLKASRSYRVYECPDMLPLIGAALDGWTVGTVMFRYSGESVPTATVWQAAPPLEAPRGAAVEGATVKATDGETVDVRTDRGVGMSGLRLWSVAGYTPTVEIGTRVLVVDLAGDPSATFALASPDAGVDGITLADGESDTVIAGIEDQGRVLRYGDTIIVPSGPAATPTPQVVMSSITPGVPVPVSKVKA